MTHDRLQIGPRWFCLTVPPQKEREAVDILNRHRIGLENVRAIEMKLQRKGGRTNAFKWAEINITPGYIFHKCNGWPNMYALSQIYGRDGLRAVSGYLAHQEAERLPATLPDAIVDALRTVDTSGLMNPHKSFQAGDLVRVADHAYEGSIAKLEAINGEKATILMEMLGGFRRIPIDVAKLRAA